MKNLATLIVMFFIVCSGKAQDTKEYIDKLNKAVTSTRRTITQTRVYDSSILFTEEKLLYSRSNESGFWSIKWENIKRMSMTDKGKVHFVFKPMLGKTNETEEYLTPAQGHTVVEVFNLLVHVIVKKDLDVIIVNDILIRDSSDGVAFNNQYFPLPDPPAPTKSAEAQLGDGIYDTFSLLSNFNWEIKGASSAIIANESSKNVYHINDARLNFVLGKHSFRLGLSPVGFSWVELPKFIKYNDKNVAIGKGDFYEIRFYSPSIGISYYFMPKLDKKDEYRMFEFPLSVNFTPLIGVKNGDFDENNPGVDSKLNEYFEPFNYYLNASLGFNMYFSDGFGIGSSIGANHVMIKTSNALLTATDNAKNTTSFTIKMEDGKKTVLNAEVRLILRF